MRAEGTSPCAVMTMKGRALSRAQLSLEFEAALARQPQVGDHAAGPVVAIRGEEGLGVGESAVG